jgi:hypothetical protein
MKTALELLNQPFARVQATAAKRGQSFKEFVMKALRRKLHGGHTRSDQPE